MLKGGIREWREKGYPITKKPEHGSREPDGKRLYAQHCASCHGAKGQGLPGHFPPLAHDPMMRSNDAWPAAWVTLYGLAGRPLAGRRYPGTMGGFDKTLSDDEVAALLTFARREFGGSQVPVFPQLVARVRREVAAAKAAR